jgi:plasmid stability protein
MDARLLEGMMAHLTIEDLDPELIDQLQKLAEQHGRSLQVELKHILEAVTQQSGQVISSTTSLSEQRGWSAGFFERTAGAWQGDLVRAPQGEYEERNWELM